MISKKIHFSIIMTLICFSILLSNSRVAFSRPNLVYRTPSSYFPDQGEGRISLGFTTEMIDFEVPSSSNSAFLNTKIKKWNVGFSYSLLTD